MPELRTKDPGNRSPQVTTSRRYSKLRVLGLMGFMGVYAVYGVYVYRVFGLSQASGVYGFGV